MLRLLLIAEECDPKGISSPFIGYKLFEQVSQFADTTLVTREKYRKNLLKVAPTAKIITVADARIAGWYSSWLHRSILPKIHNWPLRNALKYPLYMGFNRQVDQIFSPQIQRKKFDIIHAVTPIIPRYPVKVAIKARKLPFVLGPVNGGLSVPAGFKEIERQEFAYSNLLRYVSRALPGYRKTYQRADAILVGTQETKRMLQALHSLTDEKMVLMPENGISEALLHCTPPKTPDHSLHLLFVGRLVACKGIDILIRALALSKLKNCTLTIVGEGPQETSLRHLIHSLHLESKITMTGWIPQHETEKYYREADLFCFPSVRESGGAVVLEAMACGLPCLVVDNGGVPEYLDEYSGVKIPPSSPSQLAEQFAFWMTKLYRDPSRRKEMGECAHRRAAMFTWESKGKHIREVYERLCTSFG